jgi:hypothetical protein
MEFELNEDQVKDLGLNEEQVTKIKSIGSESIANIQKTLDEKYKNEANTHAEGILSGAAKLVQEKTGIERNKGEKLADYFNRTGTSFLEEKQKSLDTLKAEYEEKIKGVKDGSKLKDELETYQKKVAELEPLKEFKEKYEEVNGKYSTLKIETAFSKALPKIPESINQFEKKARLYEVRKEILSKFDIEFDENNEPIAFDKENKFNRKPLSELLSDNESIKAMIDSTDEKEGVKGFGGKPKGDPLKIEGVPFEVTKEMTSSDRAKAIRDYLTKKGISTISPEYSKQFSELNTKILKGLQ